MSGQIIGSPSTPPTGIATMDAWLPTPAGQYLLAWEQAQFDKAVADVFGYHALQLGLPSVATLRSNRIPHRWVALDHGHTGTATEGANLTLAAHSAMLPFPEASLDLITLPHTLELSIDPHASLAEVARVLVPEGRVVICGFNPASLWGFKQRRAHWWRRWGHGDLFLPSEGEMIAYRRLRDWLRLLNFEVESSQFGCYRPAIQSDALHKRFAWMDSLGPRSWPIFGAVYMVVAVKRVRGMRLLSPAWSKKPKLAGAPVSIAPSAHSTRANGHFDIKNNE
jgi:SAM-dependent methyltransferase